MQLHDLAELRVRLHDIDFPASRDVLLRAAVIGKLHPSVVIALSKLEDREYVSSFEVIHAIETAAAELQAKIDAHEAAVREQQRSRTEKDARTQQDLAASSDRDADALAR